MLLLVGPLFVPKKLSPWRGRLFLLNICDGLCDFLVLLLLNWNLVFGADQVDQFIEKIWLIFILLQQLVYFDVVSDDFLWVWGIVPLSILFSV